MKIGIIVDGQSEFESVPSICAKIETEKQLIKPLFARMQPRGTAGKIVRAAMPSMRILANRGADRVIILLDHENRPDCIIKWCSDIQSAFKDPCESIGINDVKVVLKIQMYENWLISDIKAIKEMQKRFKLSASSVRKISPGKADSVDALGILKASVIGNAYNKKKDALSLAQRLDPYRASKNSRSFRRFLRVSGCKVYCNQSKTPE